MKDKDEDGVESTFLDSVVEQLCLTAERSMIC